MTYEEYIYDTHYRHVATIQAKYSEAERLAREAAQVRHDAKKLREEYQSYMNAFQKSQQTSLF